MAKEFSNPGKTVVCHIRRSSSCNHEMGQRSVGTILYSKRYYGVLYFLAVLSAVPIAHRPAPSI